MQPWNLYSFLRQHRLHAVHARLLRSRLWFQHPITMRIRSLLLYGRLCLLSHMPCEHFQVNQRLPAVRCNSTWILLHRYQHLPLSTRDLLQRIRRLRVHWLCCRHLPSKLSLSARFRASRRTVPAVQSRILQNQHHIPVCSLEYYVVRVGLLPLKWHSLHRQSLSPMPSLSWECKCQWRRMSVGV